MNLWLETTIRYNYVEEPGGKISTKTFHYKVRNHFLSQFEWDGLIVRGIQNEEAISYIIYKEDEVLTDQTSYEVDLVINEIISNYLQLIKVLSSSDDEEDLEIKSQLRFVTMLAEDVTYRIE